MLYNKTPGNFLYPCDDKRKTKTGMAKAKRSRKKTNEKRTVNEPTKGLSVRRMVEALKATGDGADLKNLASGAKERDT